MTEQQIERMLITLDKIAAALKKISNIDRVVKKQLDTRGYEKSYIRMRGDK